MGFKENMIVEAEAAINSKRQRKEELEEELSRVDNEINEARAVLQLLRTGKVTKSPERRTTTIEEYQDAFRVLGEGGKEFGAADLATLLNITKNAAYAAVSKFHNIQFLMKVSPRFGPKGARYVLNPDYRE